MKYTTTLSPWGRIWCALTLASESYLVGFNVARAQTAAATGDTTAVHADLVLAVLWLVIAFFNGWCLIRL